jgi:transcriptional regulator with XRE-family HTH domain
MSQTKTRPLFDLFFFSDPFFSTPFSFQAALSQIESGEHRIRKATREKLAGAMGITESQLR